MFAGTCSTETDSALDHFVDCDLHSAEFSFVSEKGKGVDVAVAYVTVAGRKGGNHISLASKEENEEDRKDRRKGRRGRGGGECTQSGMRRARVSQSLQKSLVQASVT